MSWFENYDVTNIITPVKVDVYENMLRTCGYDKIKSKYLVQGFKKGFSLKFEGNNQVRRTAPNLPFSVGDKFQLWEKVMKEVKDKRCWPIP